MLLGDGLYPAGVELGLGDGMGFWTPVLLEESDHLALGHHHLGNSNAADLATPVNKISVQFSSM